MTSKEIKEDRSCLEGFWLKEIAYQLALLNEKKPELPIFEQIFGR